MGNFTSNLDANIDASGWVMYPGSERDDNTMCEVKRAKTNVAQSQTDSAIVAAVTGKKIRVLQAVFVAGATATDLTFNTKPAGAGTAISCLFSNAAHGGAALPYNKHGWFETTASQGLSCTTGAGSTTGIQLTYIEV